MKAVDLFAGLGGFTTAAEAVGLNVVWAANHWETAVEIHRENHPFANHTCQDLNQADWTTVPRHDVLLASPCCQGHCRARGIDRPHHDSSRSTAFAVIACAEVHRPSAIVVENVPEFLDWILYPSWCDALSRLGYSISSTALDSADVGVPQNRVRVFIVATRSKQPFLVSPPKCPHSPVSSVVDFERGHWSRVSEMCAATRHRVRNGAAKFGERFLVSYYGSSTTGRSVDRPCGTLTTKDRWALVRQGRMRMLSVDECRAIMGFPESYRLPPQKHLAKHLLGNAVVPPIAAWVISQVKTRI